MNDALRWLLDLDRLTFGAENVRLGFERPMPAWLWVGLLGLIAAFALWSYARLVGPRWVRATLAGARLLLLGLLLVLVAGPQLVQENETIERDWVLVLVDRTASMTIADAPDESGARITRDQELRESVASSWPAFADLAQDRNVVWLGFDAGAFDLPGDGADADASPPDLGDADGRRSAIGAALDQALRRAAARPVSGVVLLSDGRSVDGPSRAAMRTLQAERIPVFSVALGSEEPIGDLAISRIDAPSVAFISDVTPVRVDLERLGAAGAGGGTVRLIDADTGIVLDEQPIEPGEDDSTITLAHSADDPGERRWTVEIVPDGVDLIDANNRAELAIQLIDRPLRVLYVDGYPRWEQRYLKNLLIREESITSSNLLVAPDRRPSQEGDVEIDALPDSPEGWAEFDMVILGDVLPDVFSRNQLEDLREHVSIRGGGLMWIGGEGATPNEWWNTPLADLLPMASGSAVVGAPGEAALIAAGPLADQLGVLRLGGPEDDAWPEGLRRAEAGWSLIRWRQILSAEQIKPTVETIAYAAPVSRSLAVEEGGLPVIQDAGDATPVVTSMRYGAGRILYIGTDEIWRWRYGRGEQLYERFWLQLIRLLGRDSVARAGKSARITVEPRRAVVDQPVRVAVELLDQSLAELGLPSIDVRLTRDDVEDVADAPVELSLRPDGADRRVYSTTWLPTEAGAWTVEASEAALSGLDLSAEVRISLPDDELRRPETDHDLLANLSESTGGRVIRPAEMATIPGELPNRRVRLVNETTEPLWDTPLALLLALGLLTFEWVGRRVIRLI